jgi:putative transposase
MPDYRRNRVPAGTYFSTVNLRDRRSDLLVVETAAWRDAVRAELARRPFHPERAIGTLRQRESGIWQRRFWEHTIRDERDYAAHMDYIHVNPVKHGLVAEARAWEYSSFRRCVAAGLYPADWDGAGVMALMARSGGEAMSAAARSRRDMWVACVGVLWSTPYGLLRLARKTDDTASAVWSKSNGGQPGWGP